MDSKKLYAIIEKYQLGKDDEILRILQDEITTDVIMLHLNAPYKICIIENDEYTQVTTLLFMADAECSALYNSVYPDIVGYYKSASLEDNGVYYNPSDSSKCFDFTLYDYLRFARRVFSNAITIDNICYNIGISKCYVQIFNETYLIEQLENFSIKIKKIC